MRRPVPQEPGPGQESVWDYPRPPAVEESRRSIQVGGFYGGWITDDLAGPFKGMPGSMGW